jgi:hypothetical protein
MVANVSKDSMKIDHKERAWDILDWIQLEQDEE